MRQTPSTSKFEVLKLGAQGNDVVCWARDCRSPSLNGSVDGGRGKVREPEGSHRG
jgi:hypothetical protein